jgi:hypothetical protein
MNFLVLISSGCSKKIFSPLPFNVNQRALSGTKAKMLNSAQKQKFGFGVH